MLRSVTIIGVSKNLVRAVKVNPGRRKITKSLSLEWEGNALVDAFKLLRKKMHIREARILLSDDISYVLYTQIPTDLSKSKEKSEREVAFNRLQEFVPEVIDEDTWDYKIIHSLNEESGKSVEEKQAVVFAPVKQYFDLIGQAVTVCKIKITAVEPESIASQRDNNPLVGLALKTDLKGEDQDTLNLLPQSSANPGNSAPTGKITIEKSENKKSKSVYILLFILIIAASAALFFFRSPVINFAKSNLPSSIISKIPFITNEPPASSSPSEQTPSVSPTPAPTPTPNEEIDVYDYTIEVLNGSGVAGVAGEVQDLLLENGFTSVKVGNADSSDYTTTQVNTKSTVPEVTINEVRNSLRDYQLEVSTVDDQDYDIVIILGQKQ
jgi:hypothetical protein